MKLNKKYYGGLAEIGEKLVKCKNKCEGINNNPKSGIIPRNLIYEKRNGKNSCIIIGLNPGKCKENESSYYLKNKIEYDSILSFFDQNLKDKPYFSRTRNLITSLGYDGDILWTDLVKCELISNKKTSKSDSNKKIYTIDRIPANTLRVCVNKFLINEVKFFKCSTIFALGNSVFNFCALHFTNHFVVGVYHPTGSHGDFCKLEKEIKNNLKNVKKKIIKLKKEYKYIGRRIRKAIHLSDII